MTGGMVFTVGNLAPDGDPVPAKVAVNEAVELAKKFGGSDSPAFVNGVLAKFIRKEETTTETEPANEKTAQAQETEA